MVNRCTAVHFLERNRRGRPVVCIHIHFRLEAKLAINLDDSVNTLRIYRGQAEAEVTSRGQLSAGKPMTSWGRVDL